MKYFLLLFFPLSILIQPIFSQELKEMDVKPVPESESMTFVIRNPNEAILIVHSTIPDLQFESNRSIIEVDNPDPGEYRLHLEPGTHIITFKAGGYLPIKERFHILIKEFKEVRVKPKKRVIIAQEKSVIPDWFLHPRKPVGEYFYAVGMSDLNGSLEEKKEISLNRALLNFAILYRCKISSMLKDFSIADTNFTSEVIKITVENIPKTDDVTVTRRWIENDGHLYTEIKAPVLNRKNTGNTAMVKYFFQEESCPSYSSEIYESLLFFSNTMTINKNSIYESYNNKNGILDFENIFIEHNSKFKEWIGKSYVPEWYLNPPASEDVFISLGHSAAPNLYLANKFALISSLSDLSRKLEMKISNLLKDFLKETGDSSYTGGNDLEFLNDVSKTVGNTTLGGITIAERNVGIDKNGSFEVYILIEMPISFLINEIIKESHKNLHGNSSDD